MTRSEALCGVSALGCGAGAFSGGYASLLADVVVKAALVKPHLITEKKL